MGTVALLALFIAFASASQDIVIDAYAVEVLERSEQGIAVGARTALARTAVLLSGAVTITFGQRLGWPPVFVALALLFVPMAVVVLRSPEPEIAPAPPRSLREAVFDPLLELFRRSDAVAILGFLVLYKFGENLATALTRPFLIQKCFVPEDVGIATATIGLTGLITGTFFGGASTERIGLTRSLWIFGFIQAVGFLGYIAIDQLTPGSPCAGGAAGLVQPMNHRLVMYAAVLVENFCQGMATGAFGVMLLRMTQKQFSATQYALFSSIFAIGRILPGPIAGFTADAVGWTPFYLICTAASVPGLLLLQKFAPLGGREPALDQLEAVVTRPVTRARLFLTSAAIAVGRLRDRARRLGAARGAEGGAREPGARRGLLREPSRRSSRRSQVSDWIRVARLRRRGAGLRRWPPLRFSSPATACGAARPRAASEAPRRRSRWRRSRAPRP